MSSEDIAGEAFNFSNEKPINVIDLVNEVLRLMNREDLEPIILNEASNEIKNQYLSSEKARTILGWKSEYLLDQGLQKTIDWYREYFKDVS